MYKENLVPPEELAVPIQQNLAPPDKQDALPVFSKKVMIKGALWFALITVLTVAGIFFYHNTGQTLIALSHISYPYIALCLVMLGADLMLGSWRNHIYVQKLAPRVPFGVSFKGNVANMFMGAVTPAHGGAGPAQIFVYTSNGVKFVDAFAITLINMGATLIFMPLAGFAAIMLMDTSAMSGMVPAMLQYGFCFFMLFLMAFLIAFWKPLWINVAVKQMTKLLTNILPKRKTGLDGWATNACQSIGQYQKTCSVILKKHPGLFPLSLVITTLLYLNKYCMQYVILLGLGVHASLLQVISIQVLIQFMIYFAPSPGGSGFAEVSISVLFGRIVPHALLSVFTLLQRSFLLFIPALIGAVVVIGLLKKQAKNPT
jgi:uncharacterized protein (TIRG00374 family)